MSEALDLGVTDERIAEYASEHGYVVLTHDDDFLRPEYTGEITVVYYADDTTDSYEIADRVEQVTEYVPDPDDLPPITTLEAWE